MRVTDTLAFLAGPWLLHRSLTDHRSGATGTFTGTALFTPAASGPAAPGPGGPGPGPLELGYLEEGELRFGSHHGPASRSLRWLRLPGGAADVRFPDGRRFCLVDLRAGEWEADHPCGRDLYHVSYRVLGAGELEERWLVRGPGKDYQAAAILTRGARSGA